MKRIDFLAKLARALAPKNKIHAHREQRRHPALQELAADAALLGHLMPDDAHRVRTRRYIVDRADDGRATGFMVSAATREHGLRGFLHSFKNAIQHRDVEL